MEYAAIVAAVAGLIGSFISMGKDVEAQNLREKMAAEYGDDILPDLDRAVAQQAGQSAFETNREDTTGRRAQLDVLGELQSQYETGGNTAADLAAYDAARNKVARAAASQRANTQLDAARRGQAGSGLAAVLAAQSGQSELNALAELDADLATGARNRAFQALQARGQLASGMRGDDWRALEARAGASDLMNRFNATQRQSAELYNVGLPQQNFNNRMALLSARNAALNGVAQGLQQQGAAARQTAAGVGNSILSYGQAWDERPQSTDDNDDERDY